MQVDITEDGFVWLHDCLPVTSVTSRQTLSLQGMLRGILFGAGSALSKAAESGTDVWGEEGQDTHERSTPGCNTPLADL
eukprot:352972-Chlamydomonas_euryale.AAC.7